MTHYTGEPSSKLNSNEYKFLLIYIKSQCLHARECAIKAGYSPKSAAQSANRILKKPATLRIIDELYTKNVVVPYEYDAQKVLKEIGMIADADMAAFWEVDDAGYWKRPKDPKSMGPASRCIKKINFKTTDTKDHEGKVIATHTEVNMELYSRMDALEVLAKYNKVIAGGNVTVDERGKGENLPRVVLPDNGHTGKNVVLIKKN